MSLRISRRVDPPQSEATADETGLPSRAWSDYHQSVSDRLARLHSGVTDGTEADAGDVGEYVEAVFPDGIGLTNGVVVAVGSLSLGAGDWDVWGEVWYTLGAAGAPGVVGLQAVISTAVALPVAPGGGASRTGQILIHTQNSGQMLPIAPARLLLSATTPVYLVAHGLFAAGVHTAFGRIAARRMR
jgi:hypothetical protein